MNDGEALLKAVLLNKADDTPRLVYADWLEESAEGTDELNRAAFIRAQIRGEKCKLSAAQFRWWFKPWWSASLSLSHSKGKTRATPRFGATGTPRDHIGMIVTRGFHSELTHIASYWVQSGDFLLSRQPIETVNLLTWPILDPPNSISEQFSILNDPKIVVLNRTQCMHRWLTARSEGLPRPYLKDVFEIRWPGVKFNFPRTDNPNGPSLMPPGMEGPFFRVRSMEEAGWLRVQ